MVVRRMDTDRILRLRDERGIGLHEAKRIVERENLLAAVDQATTVDDIKAILRRIV